VLVHKQVRALQVTVDDGWAVGVERQHALGGIQRLQQGKQKQGRQ
jgi:hypothetical protein